MTKSWYGYIYDYIFRWVSYERSLSNVSTEWWSSLFSQKTIIFNINNYMRQLYVSQNWLKMYYSTLKIAGKTTHTSL